MDDFEKELKLGFLDEATQLLSDAEQCFLQLESDPGSAELLDKIFRLAHNFKGSAKAVGFEEMGAFAHVFESFLLKIKNGEIPKSSAAVSLLLRCNDHLNLMVTSLKEDVEAKIDSTDLRTELEAAIQSGAVASAEAAPETSTETAAPEAASEPVAEEVPAALAAQTDAELEAAIKAAELEYAAKMAAADAAAAAPASAPAAPVPVPAAKAAPAAAPAAKAKSAAPAADESVRVPVARLEKLLNFVGELVILQTVLQEQVYGNNPVLLRKTVHQLGKVTKEVQDISMSLRMVPIKQTFQKMQRIVRDTAGLLGKKVQLHLSGEETELDKTVLENISDPLVHLVRNAVDHGIESAEKRKAKGKPEGGNIHLSAFHKSGKLVIEIRDDGGGIDPAILRQKATEKGILKPGAVMSDRDAIHLIFHPGFSTKQEVSEVSGRGVGMDVVKTNIESLQGEVQIETEVGKGSCFRVVLPLTLAIIEGMVVKSNDDRFVIPLAQVHESLRPTAKDVQFNVGLGEILLLRGESLPLVRLGLTLGRKKMRPVSESIAIVIRSNTRPFAILVDDIIGQNQIVIKKLGLELQNAKVFSGSAVLGDGKPALILEPAELALMAAPLSAAMFSTISNERVAS